MTSLIFVLLYGVLGAALFYPVIEAWRSLLHHVGLHEPFRRRDYAVIGALLALQCILGKVLP